MKPKDKFFMNKAEWRRFYKNLNEVVAACSLSIKILGEAFGMVASALKNDKSYDDIFRADKYIEEHKIIKE